jgi:hypothetical protein
VAAARAAFQLPQAKVTTLAEGQSPVLGRPSASPPRRRACVTDQSYDDGSRPYRVCQARMASTISNRVHRRAIAPGWQAFGGWRGRPTCGVWGDPGEVGRLTAIR